MEQLPDFAVDILNGRHIATLATHNPDGHIHLTAVWYLYEDGQLFASVNSQSRKARNVTERPQAAFLVETREPGFEKGVTARGTATLLEGDEAAAIRRQIHERYLTEAALGDPRVQGFFAASDDVVLRLTPESWSSWDMGYLNTNFLGGLLSVENGYVYPTG